MDRVDSIHITDNLSGEVYELDFNREAIVFAEDRGFQLEDVTKYPVKKLPELFFYSFRMHHRNVSKAKTDKLFERLGGVSPDFVERLILLYNQATMYNTIAESTEEMGKNGDLAVEL